MKTLYTLIVCTLFFVPTAYSQVEPLPPTPPPPPKPMPVLLQTGGLPGIGTTLNQDYNSVGINPANLGLVTDGTPVVTFGLIGLDGGLTTNAVGQKTIENFFSDSIPYQQALAEGFANRGISLALNIAPVGISVQIPKIGGFAFTVQDRILLNMYFNPLFANIGFEGYNASYFTQKVYTNGDTTGVTNAAQDIANGFNGSYVKGSYTRTYALSFGREILRIKDNTELFVGGSLKYIVGFGFADGSIDANGNVNAFLSYSTTFSAIGDSSKTINPGSIAIGGPTAAAHGEALDLGATFMLNKDVRFGASITDLGLGSMDWTGVNYQVINSPVDSVRNYAGVANIADGKKRSTIVITHPASFTEPLPTQLHLGASMFFIQKFVVAADIDVPLNSVGGNLQQPVTTLSGGYAPSNGFRVTLGFQNQAYAPLTIPLGIIVAAGKKAVWQWGVSYADVLNLFRTNSVALGGSFFFLRFRV